MPGVSQSTKCMFYVFCCGFAELYILAACSGSTHSHKSSPGKAGIEYLNLKIDKRVTGSSIMAEVKRANSVHASKQRIAFYFILHHHTSYIVFAGDHIWFPWLLLCC